MKNNISIYSDLISFRNLEQEFMVSNGNKGGIFIGLPVFDKNIITDAKNYQSENSVKKVELADYWKSEFIKNDSLTYQRENKMKELIDVYFYFKETQGNNSDYDLYISTAEEMLFDGGLITAKYSANAIGQYEAKVVEAAAGLYLEKVWGEPVIHFNSHGTFDGGIDLQVSDGQINIDVKSLKQNSTLNSNSAVGTIKKSNSEWYVNNKWALNTDYILWVANMLSKGYIVLIGLENWSEIKEEIKSGEWTKYKRSDDVKDYFKKTVSEFSEKETAVMFGRRDFNNGVNKAIKHRAELIN